jgi:hypothetical protein
MRRSLNKEEAFWFHVGDSPLALMRKPGPDEATTIPFVEKRETRSMITAQQSKRETR